MLIHRKIDEQVNVLSKQMDYAVTVTLASQLTVLSEKITGQRTNPEDRKRLFRRQKFNPCNAILYNTSFDFGKEYSQAAATVVAAVAAEAWRWRRWRLPIAMAVLIHK